MRNVSLDRTDNHDIGLVALGANLPSRVGLPRRTMCAALQQLATMPSTKVVTISRFFVSAAYPPGSGPDYVNAAAAVVTSLTPPALLARLHEIEAAFGRDRDQAGRWASRPIDLDLIALGETVLPDAAVQAEWRALPDEAQRRIAPDRLILPHPRLQDRDFVLRPLAQIAPRWRHPLTGRTVAQMLADLDAKPT